MRASESVASPPTDSDLAARYITYAPIAVRRAAAIDCGEALNVGIVFRFDHDPGQGFCARIAQHHATVLAQCLFCFGQRLATSGRVSSGGLVFTFTFTITCG